jgi:hypothetical protein
MDMFKKFHTIYSDTLLTNLRETAIKQEIEELKKRQKQLESGRKGIKEPIEDPQGSVRQIGIALYYMQYANIIPKGSGNKSKNAKFISFLTGRSSESIRKLIDDPKRISRKEKSGGATQSLIIDLILIKNQFENISFKKGIEMIDKDVVTLYEDLKSFNPE